LRQSIQTGSERDCVAAFVAGGGEVDLDLGTRTAEHDFERPKMSVGPRSIQGDVFPADAPARRRTSGQVNRQQWRCRPIDRFKNRCAFALWEECDLRLSEFAFRTSPHSNAAGVFLPHNYRSRMVNSQLMVFASRRDKV